MLFRKRKQTQAWKTEQQIFFITIFLCIFCQLIHGARKEHSIETIHTIDLNPQVCEINIDALNVRIRSKNQIKHCEIVKQVENFSHECKEILEFTLSIKIHLINSQFNHSNQ